MHSNPPPPTVRVVAGRTVVVLRGEIDLFAVPSLSARLDELTAGPCPDLVLDLRDVAFIDCSGLGMLCRVRNRVLAREGRLRLVTDGGCWPRLAWRASSHSTAGSARPSRPGRTSGTWPARPADRGPPGECAMRAPAGLNGPRAPGGRSLLVPR
ncbi:STAS domain-containing protein [Streptomyces sp. NPDC001102]